jgi:hypothetical protein
VSVHTITPTQIREVWDTTQSGAWPFHERQRTGGIASNVIRWRGDSAWTGTSGAQMQDWLTNGYYVDGDTPPSAPFGDAEHVLASVELFEEDGDLLIDQVLNGEDLTYARWEDFEAQRGVTVRINFGMHSGTSADVFDAYFAWCLRVLEGIQLQGLAPEVELAFSAAGCFARRGTDDRIDVRIPLVKSGEVVDSVSWRAYLTRASFRMLGFAALGLAADERKRTLSSGLGRPVNPGWGVTYEDDVLTINCPNGADNFPEKHMDEQLAAAYGGA